MAHIAYLLTAQAWDERRLFLRQAPILASAGHQVSVICIEPDLDYPLHENISFVPLSQQDRRRARITGCRNIRSTLSGIQPDALVITCMEQLHLGLWVKKNLQTSRVIYDCREDHPSTIRYHKPVIPKFLRPAAAKYVSHLEERGDAVFDGLVVADPEVLRLHSTMPTGRKIIFFNVPQKSLFGGPFPRLRDRRYDLAMLGSMSLRVGVDTVIEAMGLAKSQSGITLSLLLIGQTLEKQPALKHVIDKLVSKYHLEGQIAESGIVNHKDVPSVLSQAKIGLSPHRDLLKFRRNIACKCFEYMACEMPVVCSDLPPQHLFIKDNENGFFFPSGDANKLASILCDLTCDSDRSEHIGNRGRLDFENRWNCEYESETFLHFFEDILLRNPR